MEQQQRVPAGWNVMWWFFNMFGLSVTVPFFLYFIYNYITNKKQQLALKGKVVLITGASSGLGEALAHAFYSRGCQLILVARREKELQRVKETLMNTCKTSQTNPPMLLTLDLTEIEMISPQIEKVLKIHDRIDIVVNNAGISYRGEAMCTAIDVDLQVMQINYFAQIALSKVVLPTMLKQNSGHLVFISSVQGKIAIPYRSAYAASKHALQAWCDSARAELADKNIEISVINPGYIKTQLSLNAVTGDGQKYGVTDESTEKGYSPEYVAETILHAVSQKSKETTIADVTAKTAMLLRNFSPSLYFLVMKYRARLQKKKS